MARGNVHENSQPAFLVFPTSNQVYLWRVVARETYRTISQHKELERAYVKAESLNSRQLARCAWEEQFQDKGFLCYETGTVHHLESEQSFCLKHFRQMEGL